MNPKIRMIKNTIDPSQQMTPPTSEQFKELEQLHHSLDSYSPTPLVALKNVAMQLGVKNIYIKDESKRFGLNSFKGLGAIYAISKIMKKHKDGQKPVFVTATDGNHGKAVAWAASRYDCRALVFMPQGSKECRIEAIKAIGNVRVEVSNCGYDDTVRLASAYAQDKGYYLVQDTALENYTMIPNDISLAYATMVSEALVQMKGENPTHVFLQAGVGSMAGGVVNYLNYYYKKARPFVSVVEAMSASCIYESIKKDRLTAINNNEQTIMAGLDCKEVNFLMFPLFKNSVEAFFSCPDWVTKIGIKKLAFPQQGDLAIESGESGAVGFGLLNSLMTLENYRPYRDHLGLNKKSIILLFSTEGYTDKENCQKILKGLI